MSEPVTDSPLAFATDKELLDEWARRWAGVVVIVAGHVPGEPEQEQRQIWWRGGYSRALGLAVHSYHRFIAGIAENIPADKLGDADGE